MVVLNTELSRAAGFVMLPDSAVRSVQRALDILELLATEQEGLTLTEFASRLDVPKSSAHALVHTLRRRGYITQDPAQGTFRLGLRLWELGHAFRLEDEIARLARPIMRCVVDEIDEICQLAIRDGILNVYLARVDCLQPIRLISQVGVRLYCHATGLGKALLSVEPEAVIDQLYANVTLPRFTEHTITELPALKEELRQTRERGYAQDLEEYMPGLRCVAVPVSVLSGAPPVALSLSLPLQRATPDKLAECVRLLQRAAAELAASREQGERLADMVSGRGQGAAAPP
jgi:DNA-binding IclR family transcriptional regulator